IYKHKILVWDVAHLMVKNLSTALANLKLSYSEIIAKNTFNKEKLKYSPGIPFTIIYKTRKQILQDE
ncbi:4745_t:CDS:1, partial [Racocetra persica]